jgi:glycerol-3-phosphate acyltransferase PlsY
MDISLLLGIVVLALVAYLVGAIPMGFILLKLIKNQDITEIGSGRTGGTNAMRAGGIWVGALTSVFDVLKGFFAVWLSKYFFPGLFYVQVLAAVAAVVGHNWSIWLYLFTYHKTKKLSAGAGAGPNIGAAMAFWNGTVLITIPIILFFVFIIGYASLATMATAVTIFVLFILRAVLHESPWEYSIYALSTSIVIIWSLRPNILRLISGKERRVGIFARNQEK